VESLRKTWRGVTGDASYANLRAPPHRFARIPPSSDYVQASPEASAHNDGKCGKAGSNRSKTPDCVRRLTAAYVRSRGDKRGRGAPVIPSMKRWGRCKCVSCDDLDRVGTRLLRLLTIAPRALLAFGKR